MLLQYQLSSLVRVVFKLIFIYIFLHNCFRFMLCPIAVTDRHPYAAIIRRRQTFYGCCNSSLDSETVCRNRSRLHCRCLFSAVASRSLSSGTMAAFLLCCAWEVKVEIEWGLTSHETHNYRSYWGMVSNDPTNDVKSLKKEPSIPPDPPHRVTIITHYAVWKK